MGIQGLLPLLKPITKTVHVRDLHGCRVAVDAYVWLHRGAYACAADLCQGKETSKYLNYCIEKARCLLEHGVSLYIVFDGGSLPAKRATEEERRAKRDQSRKEALRCLANGNDREAFQYWSKAVDVTPAMAHEWIKTIRGVPGIQYVVAPYEADAQLAFLSQNGFVDAIITEDSDALVFGCSRVLFKLEADGTAQQVMHKDLFEVKLDSSFDMRGWTTEMFQLLCILGGNCDYIASPAGLGLKTAYRYVHRHKTLTKTIRAIRFEAKFKISQDYEQRCQEALYTFRHQRVFDPVSRTVRHLLPVAPALAEKSDGETAYLGEHLDDETGRLIADGEIDPFSRQKFGRGVAVRPAPAVRQSVASRPAGTASFSKKPSAFPPPASRQWGIQKFIHPAPRSAPAPSPSPREIAIAPPAVPIAGPPPVVPHAAGLKRSSLPHLNSITTYFRKDTTISQSVAKGSQEGEPVRSTVRRQEMPVQEERKEDAAAPKSSTDLQCEAPLVRPGISCLPAMSRWFHRSDQPSEVAAEKENCSSALGSSAWRRTSIISLGQRRCSMDTPPTPAVSDDEPSSQDSPAVIDSYEDSLVPPCTPGLTPFRSSERGRSSTSSKQHGQQEATPSSTFSAFVYSGGFAFDSQDPLLEQSAGEKAPSRATMDSSSTATKRARALPASQTKRHKVGSTTKALTQQSSFNFDSFAYSA